MSRIAISYWGICADFEQHRFEVTDTPDGHRYGRPIIIRELLAAGHKVFSLQQRREAVPFPGVQYVSELPDVDVVFLEWRWPTFKNDRTHPDHVPTRYEPDLDRQREIIEFYRGRCPIIAWDTDHKITLEDEELYPELIIADPASKPRRLRAHRQSLPFWSDWKQLIPPIEPYPVYGFVGNNYERPDEFRRYYFDGSTYRRFCGIQTSMYGNWLQRSPERVDPTKLINDHPAVAFNHRMNFYDSMGVMNRFIATTHVSKASYYETGFVSPRFMEALAVNCPALVPPTHLRAAVLGPEWVVDHTKLNSKLNALRSCTIEQRAEIVGQQREQMRLNPEFSVSNAVRFIEDCARR